MVEKLTKYQKWKRNWSQPDSMDELAYLNFNIHPEDVLIASNLFLPKFISHEDSIFWEARFDESSYSNWKQQFGSDRGKLERMLNHVHLYDLFDQCQDDVSDDLFLSLAERMKLCWEMKLKLEFPDRKFIVELSSGDEDYGPTLVFYQK